MIQQPDLDSLRGAVRGIVSKPAEGSYAQDTAAFNLAQVHHPDAVLGALDASDVQAAVQWAAERGIPLAVQATGHNAAAPMDEGLLINTSRLQDFELDRESGTFSAGAGLRWDTVLEQLVPHGLTAAHGSSSRVGVVGYSVGGGLPLMGRALGFASDHVRSFDVVTPDGSLRRVDPETEPELFTAVRGGKGNFGIITSMRMAAVPLPQFYGGQLVYPEEEAGQVLDAFRVNVHRAQLGVAHGGVSARERLLVVGPVRLNVADRLVVAGDGADIAPLRLKGEEQQTDGDQGGEGEDPDGLDVTLVVAEEEGEHDEHADPTRDLNCGAGQFAPAPAGGRNILRGDAVVNLGFLLVGRGRCHLKLLTLITPARPTREVDGGEVIPILNYLFLHSHVRLGDRPHPLGCKPKDDVGGHHVRTPWKEA